MSTTLTSPALDIRERIDARGLVCPMPTLRLGQAVRRIAIGEIIEMMTDDPGSELNMAAWAKHTGNELLEQSVTDGIYRYRVRRVQ